MVPSMSEMTNPFDSRIIVLFVCSNYINADLLQVY